MWQFIDLKIMTHQNEYVLKNMFGSFFLATVMSALIRQLGGFTDSIVVTHLVSPDALSVVRIWQPFASCMFIIIGMMSAGAGYLSARGIGAQNYDKVNRVFNNHLYYVIFSTLLVIALALPFLDVVANMLTTNERLLPMLKPYIHADMFAIFIAAVCGVPISYVITNGSPRLITRRIIISQILNVIFDLLLCGVFDMGMVGASVASGLSNLLAFTSLLGYLRKNSKIFRLRRPEKICSIKQYRECFSIGLPMLISALLAPVLAFTMNMASSVPTACISLPSISRSTASVCWHYQALIQLSLISAASCWVKKTTTAFVCSRDASYAC